MRESKITLKKLIFNFFQLFFNIFPQSVLKKRDVSPEK